MIIKKQSKYYYLFFKILTNKVYKLISFTITSKFDLIILKSTAKLKKLVI